MLLRSKLLDKRHTALIWTGGAVMGKWKLHNTTFVVTTCFSFINKINFVQLTTVLIVKKNKWCAAALSGF